MTVVPNAFDLALVAAMFACAVVEVRLLASCRDAAAQHARQRAYVYLTAYQWALTGAVATVWVASARPCAALLLGPVNPWRLGVGLALATAYVALLMQQRRAVLARPALRERVRLSLGETGDIVPHTAYERRLWNFAAPTAGICEELLFRGFLFALAARFADVPLSVLIVSALFGLYHANQGRPAIVKTGGFGLVLSIVALASGSLVPAMIVHVAQDLIVGDIGYRAMTDGAESADLGRLPST